MKEKCFAENYVPKSISFADGFLGASNLGIDVGFLMVADEKKAKKIIKSLIKEGVKIESAKLGLDGDFRENNTEIYDGEKFKEYDAYKRSQWAQPILMVFFRDGHSEAYSCWKKKEMK